MGKYDFDEVIDRRGTGCTKIDCLKEFYGREDLRAMWIADMDFAVCPEIMLALVERLSHPVYGYATAPESYWESITGWLESRHGFKVGREELAFVPGVVKGIGMAVNRFSAEGDRIVIQPPVYHPFRMVIEGNGRVAVENPLAEDEAEGYRMDLEGLERIFAEEHPAMMILCNPHNPIGLQWSRENLASVARLAKRYGVTVVSDEIHGDLMLRGGRHIPFVESCPEAAEVGITFGAPSKTFNIPGLVSSWCVVRNPRLREPFFKWMEVNELSVPTFTATIGTEAAYRNGEAWLDEALEYIEGNLEAMRGYVEREMPGVRMVMPQASFLAWLDFRALGLSHRELVSMIVDDAHLALNDGAMFGREGDGFMRVNVALPRASLMEALGRLAGACRHMCARPETVVG